MPIFGVRGLNSGFDDADNLAWKLALVVRGVAGAALLDSYSSERIAAFHINAESAMRSTEFMSPPSRGFDLLREAALSLSLEHRGIANLINPRQTQAVRYADSPLSSGSDDLGAGPPPGEAMPEQPLGEQRHLTDLIGPSFTVLVFSAGQAHPARAACAAEAERAAARGLPVQLHELELTPATQDAFGALGALEGAVYLLRPDGHVAARWRNPQPGLLLQAIECAACASATVEDIA